MFNVVNAALTRQRRMSARPKYGLSTEDDIRPNGRLL